MPDSKTIITPSRRLSRYLRFQHANEQLRQGKHAWQTLDCLPWSAWCRRLYADLQLQQKQPQRLLSATQQEWIWQGIIKRSRYRDKLLQVNSTARQVMQAYQLCQQWSIPIFPEGVYLSEDALAFRSWVDSYEELKQKNQWLDDATLETCLRDNIDKLDIAAEIVLQGFDEVTLQQQQMLNALSEQGHVVTEADVTSRNKSVAVHAAADKRSEIQMAAYWARTRLQENPAASIGIITPRLRHHRDQVLSIFTAILSPGAVVQPRSLSAPSWSVALGKSLADYPMVDTALALIALGRRRIAIQELGKLLHSRFIKGAEQELSARAMFDMWLRQLGVEELSLRSLYRLSEADRLDLACRCEQFIQLLKDFEISFLSQARSQTLRQWAINFSQWLTLFGWPATTGLNSDEHQTLLAWQDCLSELGQLDPAGKKVSYTEACSLLRRLVKDKHFQPETAETPIQVTGMTGSAGMQFDHLWILDMQDDYWPEQSVPNAFIPGSCLQEYNVPGATAERRLSHARSLLEQLRQSAGEVIVSYAMQEGDRECRPSPLIKPWLESRYPARPVEIAMPAELIFETSALESFTDNEGPPVAAGKLATGGSSLFRDQSLCAFRAFARHRLHASSLQTIDIGLSAAQRGILTHLALQYLWQRLRDQEQLLYLSEKERSTLIHSVVSEAIKFHAAKLPEVFSDRFSELEQLRLEQLLEQWLQIERERSPFKVVATEDWQTVEFHDLELRLCVDRIDELVDGRYMIVDYKTGPVSKSNWNPENFIEPQLPLYAVTENREIAAVAFASLKPGNLKYTGEADGEDILPGVKPDETLTWPERMAAWRVQLQGLANDFRKGMATVDPLVTACRQCDLHTLCRIHERTATLDSELLMEGDDNG
ncbi:MAG: PD-(D/E)XK nuclease family protein [Gammaproteobacteria bacterium]